MILIVRQLFDPIADQLAVSLGAMARSLVIEQWLSGCRTYHRIDAHGVSTKIARNNHSPLLDKEVQIVLNRVGQVPAAQFQMGAAADYGYATAEATALLWSCMAGMHCPVLNNALVLGWVGRDSNPLTQAAVAHRCGLRARDFRLMTRSRFGDEKTMQRLDGAPPAVPAAISGPAWLCSRTTGEAGQVWIVGDRTIGALDGVSEAAVRLFGKQLGLGFGVLHFERGTDGHWRWTALDPLPLHAPAPVMLTLINYLAQHACRETEILPS